MSSIFRRVGRSVVRSIPGLRPMWRSTYKKYRHKRERFRRTYFYEAPNILEGELNFFRAIYPQCKIIVDVGARFDVDYIDISKGNGISYYLFEINPRFARVLRRNLSRFEENITVENVAVGERRGTTDYFLDSESVLQSTLAVPNSKMGLRRKVPMIRLDGYLLDKDIETVDFLKTDIECYDYFAILGLGDYLQKVRFLQFELGTGAPLGNRVVLLEEKQVSICTFCETKLIHCGLAVGQRLTS